MKEIWKDKLLLLVVAYLVAVFIAIPLTIVTLKKSQENRSVASGSAGLSFSPSPLEKNTGETFTLDVMINPGQHAVSFVSLDILYDPTKLSINPTTGFQLNTLVFPTILEGPVFTPGRIRAKVSIGFDTTKAVTTESRVTTLTFSTEAPTNNQQALVHFGESSFVLSVAPSDSATENVLNTVSPALMTLSGDPTGNGGPPVTPVPTFGGPTPTLLPTMSPTPTPIGENTPTPGPSSTHSPTPTPNAFCEESERRSGWPECSFGEATYNKQACRIRAENWKGVDGPTIDEDSVWYTWAINPPKPLSCGTTCGIAPTACQEATPTPSAAPTNTDYPTASPTSMESYAPSQANPADMMIVALLMLPIILLVGHLLV